MDVLDRDLVEAERDASPERFTQVRPYTSQQSTSSGHFLDSIPTATLGQEGTESRNRTRTRESSLHPIELGRIRTQRLQHRSTVGSTSRQQSRPAGPTLEIGAGKPLPPSFLDGEDYVVEFLGPKDPLHPQNWPFKKKYNLNHVQSWLDNNAD
jgi:DHA1 family multidrug resistance protein-like MFS transporter